MIASPLFDAVRCVTWWVSVLLLLGCPNPGDPAGAKYTFTAQGSGSQGKKLHSPRIGQATTHERKSCEPRGKSGFIRRSTLGGTMKRMMLKGLGALVAVVALLIIGVAGFAKEKGNPT